MKESFQTMAPVVEKKTPELSEEGKREFASEITIANTKMEGMEKFNEMQQIATEIQNINPEEASNILKNNPEKAKGLESKTKKLWAIANILGDVLVGGVGAFVMYKNMSPSENMDFNPASITALAVTTASILKLVYDLVSANEKK